MPSTEVSVPSSRASAVLKRGSRHVCVCGVAQGSGKGEGSSPTLRLRQGAQVRFGRVRVMRLGRVLMSKKTRKIRDWGGLELMRLWLSWPSTCAERGGYGYSGTDTHGETGRHGRSSAHAVAIRGTEQSAAMAFSRRLGSVQGAERAMVGQKKCSGTDIARRALPCCLVIGPSPLPVRQGTN